MKRMLGIYIGRFSPWHNGHQQVVLDALEHCENILILIGSSTSTDKIKNPWTVDKRYDIIQANLSAAQITNRVNIDYVSDHFTMPAFIAEVMQKVSLYEFSAIDPLRIGEDNSGGIETANKILAEFNRNNVYLLGYEKDKSSFYLNSFPWKRLDAKFHGNISATNIRKEFFEYMGGEILEHRDSISDITYNKLMEWRNNQPEEYNNVMDEWRFQIRHDAQWADSPYPPTFITADALVIQHGHILLVKRKNAPGKGTWALPGGYVHTDESLEAAAIRELIEETGLKLPANVLRRSITDTLVVDAPDRSSRGRIVTNVVKIELRDDIEKLPHVRGQDDAEKAKWFSFAEFSLYLHKHMFEDHGQIIRHMLHL